jgi:hypothetical protein
MYMVEKVVVQSDEEGIKFIIDTLISAGLGFKSFNMNGLYPENDGKMKRHFNVEITIDAPPEQGDQA